MNRSQEKMEVKHALLENLGKDLANQTVLIRARLHTSRGKGKQAFFVLRNRDESVQCVLSVGEKVSKQMVKFACSISKESIVDVEGKVSAAEVESCSVKDVELHVTQVFVVSQAVPRLPLQIEDAMRPEGDDDAAKVNQ